MTNISNLFGGKEMTKESKQENCSNCHNAPMSIRGDITKYYVCGVCHRPCDQKLPAKESKQEKVDTKKYWGGRIKHGFAVTGKRNHFYKVWENIKTRCYCKTKNQYKHYGGKGIVVEWKCFMDFKNDMYDLYLSHKELYGQKQTTIDRIDNNKNYCKENCRWATRKQQRANQSNGIRQKKVVVTYTQKEIEAMLLQQYTAQKEKMVEMCEEMKIINNVTIPVCNKCSFFGIDENYCPKCGDNLTPATSTGHIEKVKNQILDDLRRRVEKL